MVCFYVNIGKERQSCPITGSDSSLGLQEVEAPIISRQSSHKGAKVVSPNHRPHLPSPQEIFPVLTSFRA